MLPSRRAFNKNKTPYQYLIKRTSVLGGHIFWSRQSIPVVDMILSVDLVCGQQTLFSHSLP